MRRGPLAVDAGTGLVRGARQRRSPHQDARPEGMAVDLLVLHGISLPPGVFGGDAVDALFTGRLDAATHPDCAEVAGLRVSAHLFLRRGGELLQYVPLHRRAWHAGQSRWQGRSACNDFSVGIELEGTDSRPYTEAQYRTLVPLCRAVMAAFPAITADAVVGHSTIAPGRKTDPGEAFDWERLRAALVGPGS